MRQFEVCLGPKNELKMKYSVFSVASTAPGGLFSLALCTGTYFHQMQNVFKAHFQHSDGFRPIDQHDALGIEVCVSIFEHFMPTF